MTTPTIPGPRGTRLLGSLPGLRRDTLATLLDAQRRFGDVVRFGIGPAALRVSCYGLFSAEGVRHMLASQATDFRKDQPFYREIRQVAGDGLLTSQDEKYLRQRRLIQPLFTREHVDGYDTAIVTAAEAVAARWRDREVVDLADEMTSLTLRVVAEVLFGTDAQVAESTIRRHFPVVSENIARRGYSLVRTPRSWPTPGNRRVARALRETYQACDALIDQRAAEPRDTDDLLSRLLNARTPDGDRLSHQEIRDQVMIFLLAGHETTATSLAFALHSLGRYPDAQQRAHTEAHEVLHGRSPHSGDYPALPYLTMVVKEAMRLYPAAPVMGRLAVNETSVDGHVIPPGTPTLASAWVTHRHPDYWDMPSEFVPERFTPEAERRRPRYAWFPFGGGPRACIGQHLSMLESVLVLGVLLRDFRFTAVDSDVPVTSAVTMRPRGEVLCRVSPRRD